MRMPPPANPVESPRADDWQLVEARMLVELPSDYKEFIATYGTGAVDNFLWVLNPFSHNDNLNLIKQVGLRSRISASVRRGD